MTALADKLRALLAGGTALAAEIEAFELSRPTPHPAPAPAPVPAPAPIGPLSSMVVNHEAEVIFEHWSPLLSRYTRSQGVMRLAGSDANVKIIGHSAGVLRALSGGAYTLFINGEPTATATPASGATEAVFSVNADALTSGWHELRVVPTVSGESCIPYYALVPSGAAPVSEFVPVATASYSLALDRTPVYRFGKAPATYAPTKMPLAPRERVPFSTLIPTSDLHCEQLAPVRFGDVHRVSKTREGFLTSFANQSYDWSNLITQLPHVPLLDGPRGAGTVCMATHLEVGTAAPPGVGFVNNTYFCDPWRVGKIRQDGTVITMVGWRHKSIASHWQDTPDLELVGDWSAIPEDRRGFWEVWGMAWDRRRDGVNNVGDPSPDPRERGLIPHPVGGGAVIFLSDSQHNRIVRCEFPHDTHFAYERTKVTEFLTGLDDPWDCVGEAGVLYVSERKAHRICAYSMDSGELLRVVVQGTPWANIGADREARRTVALDVARSADCVAPEGLFLQDGWLYWGSRAQGQVKRVHLESGAIEAVHNIVLDDNVKFVKIALSDGSFGPRGLLAMATWSAADYGWPRFIGWSLGYSSYSEKIAGRNAHFNYPTAVGFGGGQMVFGGVNEGILRVSKRLPTDSVASEAVKAGAVEWFDEGHYLTHGHFGFGFYGLPLPWGKSANKDAFLKHHGHKEPA